MYLKENDIINTQNGNESIAYSDMPDTELTENIFWILVNCFLFIAIILGNVLTVVAIAVTRRLKNVVSNYFVLNLAVSDLLVGMSMPYYLAFYITHDTLNQESICVLRFVLINISCCSSMYNIVLIAIDRYVAIVHPLSYNAYTTRKRMLLIIASTWFYTISISTIPLYWNRFDPTGSCEFQTVLPRYYILAIQLPSYLLAWLTMLLLYVKIWKEAQECARRMNLSIVSNFTEKNDRRSIHVVLIIIGCFTISWIPCFVVASIRSICDDDELQKSTDTLYKTTFTLALANSGMNPLIYAWKNTNFRQAFQKILRLKSPNNKFNSSLMLFLEQQRNEIKNKQKHTEIDHYVCGNSSLHAYPFEPQNNHAEEAKVENTTL